MMRRLRPEITNVATPKAGLLGGVGGVAVRRALQILHIAWITMRDHIGTKSGKLLVLSERIACRCAHSVICVSESLRQKAIELGIVDAERTVVFASGSFRRDRCQAIHTYSRRFAARRANPRGIGNPGRSAGHRFRWPPDEGQRNQRTGRSVPGAAKKDSSAAIATGGRAGSGRPAAWQDSPLPRKRARHRADRICGRACLVHDHVMDAFAFPTYREGFGNVALEANAAGKPVVAFRATGPRRTR